MDEIRGSPGRRLSQILDPIARLASDFGSSSSAPCSPRMGVRGSTRDNIESARSESCRGTSSGPESPRLLPRRARQPPVPPPRPSQHQLHQHIHHHHPQQHRNESSSSSSLSPPIHFRNSPYVNVPCNLVFQKDKSFAESAKCAGYSELKETAAATNSAPASTATSAKPLNLVGKCNPYTFTSEPSGRVEYADIAGKINYSTQIDIGPNSFENKALDVTQNFNRLGRSLHDQQPGTSSRTNLDRSCSFSTSQHQVHDRREYGTDPHRLLIERAAATLATASTQSPTVPKTSSCALPGTEHTKRDKSELRPTYGSSKSFDGYSSTVEELNWQERCLELQLELHRSRSQATRVRDMLREKVSSQLTS